VAHMHPADAYATISKHVDGAYTRDEVLTTRRAYAAMCAMTDDLLGRILDAAAATGHLGPRTYTLFLSDHGEMAMEHRQVWKNTMYEGSARVPLLLAGPQIREGVRVTQLTSLLDLFPTLLELFGVAPSPAAALDGASLLNRSSLVARSHVVAQYHSNMVNTGTFMLRTSDGFKYIAFGTSPLGLESAAQYPPQLFHVESDPDELNDLAAAGGHTAKVAELDSALRAVVDYPKVDKQAKAVDHWLFEQWFVLAGHHAKSLEDTWRAAYGNNFTDDQWVVEWRKAQTWMGLNLK